MLSAQQQLDFIKLIHQQEVTTEKSAQQQTELIKLILQQGVIAEKSVSVPPSIESFQSTTDAPEKKLPMQEQPVQVHAVQEQDVKQPVQEQPVQEQPVQEIKQSVQELKNELKALQQKLAPKLAEEKARMKSSETVPEEEIITEQKIISEMKLGIKALQRKITSKLFLLKSAQKSYAKIAQQSADLSDTPVAKQRVLGWSVQKTRKGNKKGLCKYDKRGNTCEGYMNGGTCSYSHPAAEKGDSLYFRPWDCKVALVEDKNESGVWFAQKLDAQGQTPTKKGQCKYDERGNTCASHMIGGDCPHSHPAAENGDVLYYSPWKCKAVLFWSDEHSSWRAKKVCNFDKNGNTCENHINGEACPYAHPAAENGQVMYNFAGKCKVVLDWSDKYDTWVTEKVNAQGQPL